MMSTTALTARKFILEYDKDTLNDIANYGCISGVAPDFIYTKDILNFFNDHQQEIENELELVYGEGYVRQLLRDDDIDLDTLITRMVWDFVALVAQDEVLSYD